MKVLVIGKGGREHALCWRLRRSPSVDRLFCAGGNAGIAEIADVVALEPAALDALADFAVGERIDLTVVGPEEPLALGVVDRFERRGLKILGPSKAAAQLEASKAFAKSVMIEAGVPTAESATFDDAEAARRYIRARAGALVVKADGLAAGKGVVVCADRESALAAVSDAMERRLFGAAGERVIIERRLYGEELSCFALCDGERAVALGLAQDHKRALDGDQGPNTGGMGAYSPVPQFAGGLEARVMREVVTPVLAAMRARGTPFRGVLYVGLMSDGNCLSVLEFNVRFGDPECEALMMRLEGDLGELLLAAAEGALARVEVKLSPKSAVAVVLASGGYPGSFRKGLPIRGVESAERIGGVTVFHAGTALRGGQLVTDGGRVMVVTALADTLAGAAAGAYRAADLIEFEGKHMRRDIARRALERGTAPC